jgi:hypothetical protein
MQLRAHALSPQFSLPSSFETTILTTASQTLTQIQSRCLQEVPDTSTNSRVLVGLLTDLDLEATMDHHPLLVDLPVDPTLLVQLSDMTRQSLWFERK